MSAPVLWGALPMGVAFFLLIFRRWERQVNWIGAVFMLLLAGSVWLFPVNEAVRFGPWSLRLGEVFEVLGRRFVIMDADRGMFGMIYLFTGVWFLGALITRPGSLFVPLGMVVVVLWTGVLAVEPFLFAALILGIGAMVSVPFLRPPGGEPGQGILRFLSFQTLGMPFILFTGWIVGNTNPEIADPGALVLPAVLLGFGFAFLLAIFPFHTWLPMLAEETHPFTVSFLFLMLPFVVELFGLGFLNEFDWLRNSLSLDATLHGVGFLMTSAGGLWAAMDFTSRRRFALKKKRHLARILGYSVMVETGFSLLALRLVGTEGLGLFFELMLPRTAGYFLWALALTSLEKHWGSLEYSSLQGASRKYPGAAIALILAQFSVAGFPLLAGFPSRLMLLDQLASANLIGAFGVVLGGAGLLIAGLRTLAVLVMSPEETGDVDGKKEYKVETPAWSMVWIGGVSILFLMGLFPHWFVSWTVRIPLAFPALLP